MFGNVKIDIVGNEPKINGVINNLTPRGVVEIMEAVMDYLDNPDIEAYQKIKSIYDPVKKATPRAEPATKEKASEAISLLEQMRDTPKEAPKETSEGLPFITSSEISTMRGAELRVMHYILGKTDADGVATINTPIMAKKVDLKAGTVFNTVTKLENRGFVKRLTRNQRENLIMPLKRFK